MKPLYRKIAIQSDSSFSVQHYVAKHFYNFWHFHPELELVLFLDGTGTRLIGDSVENIRKGELILIGSNLPHLMRSDDTCNLSESLVIHFLEDFGGKDFINIPEMRGIRDLFHRAQRGIIFKGDESKAAVEFFHSMENKKGIDSIINLLEILKSLAVCKEVRYLSKIGSGTFDTPNDTARINKIYAYVLTHFYETLTVDDMAKIANLSTTSFCRYFKKCTNKTFLEFLMEVRIGYACKQLIETDKPVNQICSESGYNSLSNFNLYFKKMTKMSPLVFKKNYQSK